MAYECILRLEDGKEISNWKSYQWDSDFLTPSDGWSFKLGLEDTTMVQDVVKQARPGTAVSLVLKDYDESKEFPLGAGRVDSITTTCARSGTDITIAGRDAMAPLIDSMPDPAKFHFKPDQLLQDIVQTMVDPFGLKVVATDDVPSVDFKGQQRRGTKVSKRGKPVNKSKLTEQLKVQKHENAYNFCARICRRCGFHIWPSIDGKTVYIGKPNFDQAPEYKIEFTADSTGVPAYTPVNIVGKLDATGQPSAIIASGRSTSVNGAQAKPAKDPTPPKVTILSRDERKTCFGTQPSKPPDTTTTVCTVIQFNELVVFDSTGSPVIDFDTIKSEYPGANVLEARTGHFIENSYIMPLPKARPLYAIDDEAHTMEEVENLVRREMSNRQRKALDIRYLMEGHVQEGVPWAVDKTIDVVDAVLGIKEPMYIFGVSYVKSRTAGTTTELHLVRPWTMDF